MDSNLFIRNGNTSNAKSLGDGVFELKIDFGPGSRIFLSYADQHHYHLIVYGGTKQRNKMTLRKLRNIGSYTKNVKIVSFI